MIEITLLARSLLVENGASFLVEHYASIYVSSNTSAITVTGAGSTFNVLSHGFLDFRVGAALDVFDGGDFELQVSFVSFVSFASCGDIIDFEFVGVVRGADRCVSCVAAAVNCTWPPTLI